MNLVPRACETRKSTMILSLDYLDCVDSRGGGVSTPPYPLSARELFSGWVLVSISSTPSSSHSLSSPPNPSSLLSQSPFSSSLSLSCFMISSAAAATSARLSLHETSVKSVARVQRFPGWSSVKISVLFARVGFQGQSIIASVR